MSNLTSKSIFGARVLRVDTFPTKNNNATHTETTSIMARIVTQNGLGIVGHTVDLRLRGDVAKRLLDGGVTKGNTVTFEATGLFPWEEPNAEAGIKGDRMLKPRIDRTTGKPIPGTETKVYRIMDFNAESVKLQAPVKPLELAVETNTKVLEQNKTLCETAAIEASAIVAADTKPADLAGLAAALTHTVSA